VPRRRAGEKRRSSNHGYGSSERATIGLINGRDREKTRTNTSATRSHWPGPAPHWRSTGAAYTRTPLCRHQPAAVAASVGQSLPTRHVCRTVTPSAWVNGQRALLAGVNFASLFVISPAPRSSNKQRKNINNFAPSLHIIFFVLACTSPRKSIGWRLPLFVTARILVGILSVHKCL